MLLVGNVSKGWTATALDLQRTSFTNAGLPASSMITGSIRMSVRTTAQWKSLGGKHLVTVTHGHDEHCDKLCLSA